MIAVIAERTDCGRWFQFAMTNSSCLSYVPKSGGWFDPCALLSISSNSKCCSVSVFASIGSDPRRGSLILQKPSHFARAFSFYFPMKLPLGNSY